MREPAWPQGQERREGHSHTGSHHRHQAEKEEAEKDITKQNTRVLVGFRNAYVFEVAQTEGAELPEMREISGDVGSNRDRLVSFIEKQGIELVFTENIAPALSMSYGGRRDSAGSIEGRRVLHAGSRTGARNVAQSRAPHRHDEGGA
jgi:hypothetical protein